MSRSVNILGTDYAIHYVNQSDDAYMKENDLSGYANFMSRQIFVANAASLPGNDTSPPEDWRVSEQCVLRHEILHAFLRESGLDCSAHQTIGSWSRDEEIVDWFAIQSPKIFKAYQDADAL